MFHKNCVTILSCCCCCWCCCPWSGWWLMAPLVSRWSADPGLGAVGGGGAARRADKEAGRELVATAACAGGGLAPGAEADRATGGGVAPGGLSLSLNRGNLRFLESAVSGSEIRLHTCTWEKKIWLVHKNHGWDVEGKLYPSWWVVV